MISLGILINFMRYKSTVNVKKKWLLLDNSGKAIDPNKSSNELLTPCFANGFYIILLIFQEMTAIYLIF